VLAAGTGNLEGSLGLTAAINVSLLELTLPSFLRLFGAVEFAVIAAVFQTRSVR
jgi:hypothetical protein